MENLPTKTIKNYRVLSIVPIFFSLVPGLVALNYSWQVDKAIRDGDIETAKKHSKTARTWVIVSFTIAIIFVILRFAIS